MLEEFFGRPRASPSSTAEPYELDVVIATLPDPIDSHLDWGYDFFLEAIRRAFETTGYVLDRLWIPSSDDSATITDGSDASGPNVAGVSGSDGTAPLPAARLVPAREAYPSVFLFRSTNAGDRKLRLLYVVGEIPTGGIQKESLRNALEERRVVLGLNSALIRPVSAAPIRIIGPTFSGSATSVEVALKRWSERHPNDQFELISGSATAIQDLGKEDDRISFGATVHGDAALELVLLNEVLPRLGISPGEVAILRESSTQYGQSHAARTSPGSGFVVIPFPMNISSLRTEYARSPENRSETLATQTTVEQPRVSLSLRDSVRRKEGPPVHSALTAPAIDLILDEITNTLRNQNIRAVGLYATDVRDKLFLGEYIRSRLRDVQLFTFDSNMLFLRGDYNSSLKGMLVLSTYPLFLESQARSTSRRDDGELLLFGSDGATGIYNATLFHLGNPGALVDYGFAPADSSVRGVARPPIWLTVVGSRSFLPLRVTPNDSSSEDHAGQEVSGASVSRTALPISFLAYGAWILLGGAIAGVAAWMIWSELPDRRISPADAKQATKHRPRVTGPWPHRDYLRLEWASLLVHRQLYRAILLIALAAVFLPPAVLIWKSRDLMVWPADLLPRIWWVGSWLAILFGLSLWLVAFAMTVRQGLRLLSATSGLGVAYWCNRTLPASERALWRVEVVCRFFIVLLIAVFLICVVAYSSRILLLSDSNALAFDLFLLRAKQLDSGLSPLPPIMLTAVGLGVWSIWHLRRITLLLEESTPLEHGSLRHRRSTRSGASDFGAEPRRSSGPAEIFVQDALVQDLRRRLFRLFPNGPAVLAAVVVTFVIGWLLLQFGQSLETLVPLRPIRFIGPFDVIMRFGVVSSLVGTSWAVYRLLTVWWSLRRYLTAVEASDLRTAFERLPKQIARLTRLTVLDPAAREIVRGIEETHWHQLKQIAQAEEVDSDCDQDFSARIASVSIAGAAACADPKLSTGDRFRRRALSLECLRRLLADLWQQEPTPEDIGKVAAELSTPNATTPSTNTSERLRRTYTGTVGLWIRVAEELLAISVVDYLEWVLRHLRRLALFLLLSLVVATLLLSSYPFQPQSVVKVLFFAIVAASIASLIGLVNELNRNDLLSRITRTHAGQVDWDFTYVSNLLLYGGIPLLTIISAEFPQVREILFAWVEPLLRTISNA